jgi:hypothetical protein
MKIEKGRILGAYRGLISLYPPAFIKRFGESMEQTFNDVCNEENGKISLGLMVSMFGDTSVGMVKENLHEFKSAGRMSHWHKTIVIAAILSLLFSATFFSVGTFFKDNPEVWSGGASFPIDDFIRKWLLLTLILTPTVSGLRSSESTAMKDWIGPLGGAALFSTVLIAPFAWMEWSNNPPIQVGESLFPYPLFLGLVLLPMLVFLGAIPIVRALKAGRSVIANPFSMLVRSIFLVVLAINWVFLIKKHMPLFLGD